MSTGAGTKPAESSFSSFFCINRDELVDQSIDANREFLSTTMSSWKTALRRLLVAATLMVAHLAADVQSQRQLIWSDECDGPAGSAPDAAKWRYDIGGGGWGNNELEYYTDSRANSACDGQGHLVITATPDGAGNHNCWYGQCRFTSARILTKGLFSTKFGRIEARIRVPYGKGVWPAFWSLGDDIDAVGWPQCGEIDITEVRGSDPLRNLGTLHGPGYSGGAGISGTYVNDRWLSEDFHVYAIDWNQDRVQWSVDGNVYETRTPADLPANTQWVFNKNFFLILNVAVGGNFDGEPDSGTQFPQTMSIDYVRVYSE